MGAVVILFAYFFVPLYLNKKRTKQLAGIASDLKLSFYPDGKDSIFESISFGDFVYGCAKNMMHGEVNNAEFAIFDHLYQETKPSANGLGRSSRLHKQTVIYFKSTNLKLPRFTLSPENFFHTDVGQDIDFRSHPDFSKRFLLHGENEPRIRRFFTDKLLTFLELQQKITVEGGGDQLLLYRDNKRVPPEEWQSFIDQGFQFFNEFVGSD